MKDTKSPLLIKSIVLTSEIMNDQRKLYYWRKGLIKKRNVLYGDFAMMARNETKEQGSR